MRIVLLSGLALACSELHPPPGVESDPLHKGESIEGAGTELPVITAYCTTTACGTVWLTQEPAPAEPATWFVDDDEVGPVDGVEVEVVVGQDRQIAVKGHDGSWSEAWLQAMAPTHGDDDEGSVVDTNVVILGLSGNSCNRFHVETVGGCITMGTDVRFVASLPTWGEVVFGATSAPSMSLQRFDHGYVWWWPTAGRQEDPNAPPEVQLPQSRSHGGLEYWFALQPDETVDLTAHHGWFGSNQARPHNLPRASCSTSGQPVLLPPLDGDN